MNITVKHLDSEIVPAVTRAFSDNKINRPIQYFEKCLVEQSQGIRNTLIAFMDDRPVGTVHLIKDSKYPFFLDRNTPEINDLIVFNDHQKQGIGRNLIIACEKLACQKGYSRIGLGVGLYKDYGTAQRLYFRLGYKPDGNGLMYSNEPVPPGTSVLVDDDLLIYLVKELTNNK